MKIVPELTAYVDIITHSYSLISMIPCLSKWCFSECVGQGWTAVENRW